MASMVNSSNTIVPETQEQDVNMVDQNAANVMAISATNTNSPTDVHVDVEQCVGATTAQMDRIWVDLIGKMSRVGNIGVHKDDDVIRDSPNRYSVTNFPESISARDLWKSCSVYGTYLGSDIDLKENADTSFCRKSNVSYFLEYKERELSSDWQNVYKSGLASVLDVMEDSFVLDKLWAIQWRLREGLNLKSSTGGRGGMKLKILPWHHHMRTSSARRFGGIFDDGFWESEQLRNQMEDFREESVSSRENSEGLCGAVGDNKSPGHDGFHL
ncbi:hypothetical protein Tco_1102303 [Tanacetum coccineum]